jgi:CHAT domain-containing protein/tetratricopeptide (TPR) repeat protein
MLLGSMLVACSGSATLPLEHPRIREGRELYDRSEFEKAQQFFQTLLSDAELSGDLLLQAQAQKWLGNILLSYEQPEEALGWYRRSLALIEERIAGSDSSGKPAERTWFNERQNVLSNTAVVYKNTQRFDEAENVFRSVLAYDSTQGDTFRIAISLYNLGDVFNQHAAHALKKGDTEAFTKHQQVARQLFFSSLAATPTADAWLNLGNNYAFANQLDSAIIAYHRAEAIYNKNGFRVHRALALGNIGVLALRQKRPDEAVVALRQSIDIVEELRGNISSIDVRSSFVSDKFYIYENLISILVEMDSVHTAFQYVERAKARSFLDLIGNKAIGQGKDRRPEVRVLVEEEQQLQKQISALMSVPDSSTVLGKAIERHQEVIGWLREKDPEYASVKSIDPVSVSALQGMLDDTTALIEYFVGQQASFVFLVRRDTILVRKLKLGLSTSLEREVETLRRKLYYDFPMKKTGVLREQRLGQRKSAEEATAVWQATVTDHSWQYDLVSMYSRLIVPVAQALQGIRNLYIVPHGALHHVPFQALVAPTGLDHNRDAHVAHPRFLIEDYAISYLPSASVLSFALTKDVHRARTALIVGDPIYADPKYRRRPLEGALIEADSVASYTEDPMLLKRADAEEAVVKKNIGEKDLLHFATHGELNKEDPMQSRILLAAAEPDSINNGNLTVAKIFNLDLRAVLVTLSACQTAQLSSEEGGFTPGDDLVGLTRSFMYAGTPSVIASLWYVDDAATLEWMRAFYKSWLHGTDSKMQAARRAALRMLSNPTEPDWVFPYYWAAFVYMGDAR